MTEVEMNKEIKRLLARLKKLHAVKRGDSKLERHWRDEHWVKRYHVQGHWVHTVVPVNNTRKRKRK